MPATPCENLLLKQAQRVQRDAMLPNHRLFRKQPHGRVCVLDGIHVPFLAVQLKKSTQIHNDAKSVLLLLKDRLDLSLLSFKVLLYWPATAWLQMIRGKLLGTLEPARAAGIRGGDNWPQLPV